MKESTLLQAVRNVLMNDRYVEELSSRPVKMAETAAIDCFLYRGSDSSDENTIRLFLREIYEKGHMEWEAEDEKN
jgi:hypothetical protein